MRAATWRTAAIAIAAATRAAAARADDADADADAKIQAIIDAAGKDPAEVVEINGKVPEEAQPTSYEITADEIRSIPGAANDALRALQGLPGVARIPFSFGGLVLRGTSPRDSRVFLDGVEVPIAFHFGGVTSFYPSDLLDHIALVNGNYDVEYGRGIGGMIELTTRAPRTDRWRMGAELSLVDSSVHAEGPLAGGGLVVGVRRSWIDAVIAAIYPADYRFLPRYYDAQLQWTTGAPTDRGGAVTATAFYSDDHGSIQGLDLSSRFGRAALRWVRQLGHTRVEVTPWLGVEEFASVGMTRTSADGDGNLTTNIHRTNLPAGVRAKLVRDTAWGHAAAGLDLDGGRYGTLDGKDPPFWSADVAAWGEVLWRLGERVDLRPGLRVDRYGTSRAWLVEPRENASVTLADGVILRQGLGLFHQPPFPSPTRSPADVDGRSVEAMLGLDLTVRRLEVAVTGYYIDQDLLPSATGPDDKVATIPMAGEGTLVPIFGDLLAAQLDVGGSTEHRGRGRGAGVELSIKRHVGGLLTWLSYTYGHATRAEPWGPYRGWHPYELDQPHNLSAVVAIDRGGWRLGARVQATSGVPYTPIVAFPSPLPGVPIAIPGRPYSARVPPFVSLDLRVDHTWTRAWGAIDAFIDLQNASNRDNPEAVYDQTPSGPEWAYGLPILPIVGVGYAPPP